MIEIKEQVLKGMMYPKMKIGSSTLKDVKDWKVGESYDLNVKVEMVASHLADDKEVMGDFIIKSAKAE